MGENCVQIQMFLATKNTHRFKKNQKVWVRARHQNHLDIYFKWRGKGRYVTGVQDRFADCVGNLKTFAVDKSFATRVINNY